MIDIDSVLEYSRDLNVLYVEDDIQLQEQTSGLLEDFFKTIDVADNGESGLVKYNNYFNETNDYYDLVISDINMPKKNGIEFSSDVLKINNEQKILIISAHNESTYLNDLINIGVTGFLLKPVNINQLFGVLYRTTQAISDRKTVKTYYDEIDKLDEELIKKNNDLERSLRLLKTNHKKSSICATVSQNKSNDKTKDKQAKEDSKELLDALKYELPELRDICTELDVNIIDIVTHEKYSEIPKLLTLFSMFATSLSAFYVFAPLQSAIISLVATLEEDEAPKDERNIKNGILLIESLIYSLNVWVDEWGDKRSENISFYDASIISDVHSIINFWTNVQDDDENEIELF